MQYFKKPKKLFKISFIFTALFYASLACADLVVIGNSNIKIAALTKKELGALYLSQPIRLSTKENLIPIGQPDDSQTYLQFYQKIMGWNSNQANAYWSTQIFSGQSSKPESADDEAAAIAQVKNTPNAIAYVDSSALGNIGNSVKILYGHYTPPPKPKAKPKTAINHYAKLYDNEPQRSSKITGYHSMYDTPDDPQSVTPNIPIAQSNSDVTPDNNSTEVNNAILNELSQVQNGSAHNIWSLIADQIHLGPEVNLPRVQTQIKWFSSHPKMLNHMIHNASPFIYYVYQEIQRRHMPMQFALLPMVESDYYPYAYSNVGAAGIWQMMPETAADYGLKMDWWYDARRDIITSTNAALNFLVTLHASEKNWDLAAAAYNAGEGSVDKAMKRNRRAGKSLDYWDLPLPQETRDYVPKLLAIAAIIKNPGKYGITMPNIPAAPYFVAFNLNSQINVADAAKLAEVPESIIVRLNTGMRRFASNLTGKYTLLIPAMAAKTFQENLAKIAGKPEENWKFHAVKPGESLESIANNYHVTLAVLETVNKLKNAQVKVGSGILVPVSLGRDYENPINVIQPSSQTATIPQSAEFAPMPKVDTWAVEKITTGDILTGKNMDNPITAAPAKPAEKSVVLVQPQALVPAVSSTHSSISANDDLKTLLGKIYPKSAAPS